MARLPREPERRASRRGVVAVAVRGERFLAICRSAQVVAPGALCFPGGGIEPGESERQAVEREFREELGAAVEPLACLWRSTTAWGVELAWWFCQLSEASSLAANPAEVASIHWLTSQEMLAHEKLLESNRAFFAALAAGAVRARVARGPAGRYGLPGDGGPKNRRLKISGSNGSFGAKSSTSPRSGAGRITSWPWTRVSR